MKPVLTASRKLVLAFFALGFLVLACQLGQETKVENSLSFSKHYDSLSRYDSLVIEVKDPDGRSLGIIYKDKPAKAGDLDKLIVPGWDGGPIDIFISGYMRGHDGPVFQVKKSYDGKTDKTGPTVVIIDPNPPREPPTRLGLEPDTLRLAAHGAAGRFTVKAEPAGADAGIEWRLEDSTLAVQRSDGAFLGLARGKTKVTAASKLKPEISASAWIVVTEPVPVASVRFRSDSLTLFLGGAPESLVVEVLPAEANQEVALLVSDTTKASLADRVLTPKATGDFTVRARSLEDSTKSATLKVSVREPLRVEKVVAADSEATLYLGGPGRTLAAKVLPDNAPQSIRWKSLSPTIVSVDAQTGSIAPLQAGFARIVATSAADSTQRDTVAVSVKVDAPRLTVTAADSVVSAGASVAFHANAAQEFGQLNLFQWDLDGNGAWDDSLTGPWTGTSVDLPPVTAKYDKAGRVTARFRVRDSEGNATSANFAVRVVGGAAVTIDSPKDNSYTNQKTIGVAWSVNGKAQDSLLSETLAAPGPNVITRSARDSAGKVQSASITVYLDTTAPLKPVLSGTSPTNAKPKWTWSSGGNGGSGEYRYRLGDANFPANAPTVRDSSYSLAESPVSGTTYTLFLQERDVAGNWSPAASLAIRYDVTSPVVAIATPLASGTYYTSATSVILTGTASGPVAISKVAYRIGTGAAANATFSAGNWSTPAIPLQEGSPALVTVTATDQAGNSGEAILTVFADATPPAAPAITTSPAASIAAVKGTFEWTAGSDGAGSGLNGHYRYAVNGGAWKDTTGTLLANLPLADGSNIFSVQEQDKAGNWSPSASKSVKVDIAGPILTLTSHANPYNSTSLSITLSGQVKDSGTGVAAMTVSGQTSGSGTVTVTAGTWTTAALTLKSGANALLLTATDQVGNASTLTATVNVNVPAPVVVITNPSDSLTVTRNDTITVSYTIDGGAVQTKSFNLIEGVNRLVVSSPANASGNIGRDTVKVTRDATPPNAPALTRGTSPTNGTATWNWTSGGDNAGGAGLRVPAVFRYSLDAGATWTQTSSTSFQQASAGSWTLVVQEQDKAGNWSASSSPQTVVVDKTAPVVVISGLKDKYVTSLDKVPFSYSVDNGPAKDTICNLTNANGANTCSAKSTDAAGNVGTASVTVYCWSNVVFVTVAGAGNRSGANWENAKNAADFSTAAGDAAFSGKEFWVGKGTYDVNFQSHNDIGIYGGFDATKTPYDKTNRDNLGTRIGQYFFVGASSDATSLKVTIDGIVLEVFGSNNITATLNNVTLSSKETSWTYGMEMLISNVTANNLVISGNTYGSTVLDFTGTFKMVGGSITNNTTQYSNISIGGAMTLSNGAVISGNMSNSEYPKQANIAADGSLTIGTGVNFSCSDVINTSGGTCR